MRPYPAHRTHQIDRSLIDIHLDVAKQAIVGRW
jgi:hypothetical protein